ncbi:MULTISPECIES: hypothetical protein [Streptomyces]|uniref:hypothetical protein n=1 Tax=Streptomyces TaxID=1883 RepID=UPI00345C494E
MKPEKAPCPGRWWETRIVRTEVVVVDDAPDPIINRAARRATARASRRQNGIRTMTEPVSQARLFVLQRDRDLTGISGTGIVADGVLWPDGTVTVRWRGPRPSTVQWNGLDDAEAVHGHSGATRIIWTDTTRTTPDTDSPDGALTSTDSVRTPTAALRRLYMEALRTAAHQCDGACGLDERACYDAHPITWSGMAGGHTHIDGAIDAIVDTVLAVHDAGLKRSGD